MQPYDPMAVAVDWLDAYRAARINQIVGMYSPDAVIECACGGRKIVHGQESIVACWRHRVVERSALGLEDLQVDGAAVAVSYRTSSGIVRALLDIADNRLIVRCRCGPATRDLRTCREERAKMQDTEDAGHVSSVRETSQ
jgi:hypothetical protein